ncbi:MAG: hypothetical protein K2Y56_13150 [Methylobacterium sp.]|uniref:hypothetical protein n=1 Tax=Methylobacterium sp. TaxID=409 RepID=UPI0025E8B880|nr:hypothetical protein [Methylobacterium sp.]MBX9932467.1 hypothetical protein [Methylobacterium sp.]
MVAAIDSLIAEYGPGFAAILDVCEATSLEEAAIRGGRLGWPVAPEDRDWRAGFERYEGGTVRVVGWRRGARGEDGLLSYWVASGPNARTACAFSTDRPHLLGALRDRFGAPDTFEEQGDIVNAYRRRGGLEVSFTRIGASSSLSVARRG